VSLMGAIWEPANPSCFRLDEKRQPSSTDAVSSRSRRACHLAESRTSSTPVTLRDCHLEESGPESRRTGAAAVACLAAASPAVDRARLPLRSNSAKGHRTPPEVARSGTRSGSREAAVHKSEARLESEKSESPADAGLSVTRGVGFEPTTLRLTAECSAVELPPTAPSPEGERAAKRSNARRGWPVFARTARPGAEVDMGRVRGSSIRSRAGRNSAGGQPLAQGEATI
jgi:hypothetical protein